MFYQILNAFHNVHELHLKKIISIINLVPLNKWCKGKAFILNTQLFSLKICEKMILPSFPS